MGDSEAKVYYTIPMPSHTIFEEMGEPYLSQTTVEGEGEVGGGGRKYKRGEKCVYQSYSVRPKGRYQPRRIR